MWYFELFLVVSTTICLILSLFGWFFKSQASNKFVKFGRSYLGVFLLVLTIRSFVFQPFKVVSGSLEPTVLIGDILAVNQSAYGVRLPLIHKKILATGQPKIGDIALFYFPEDPSFVFVKRVIGTPGDHVEYHNKILKINGKVISQHDIGIGFDEEPGRAPVLMNKKEEDLLGTKHQIYLSSNQFSQDVDVIVPPNHYFMMGDNRDDSDDSRRWGFVPDENLIGRAYRVLVSWDSERMRPRLARVGQRFKL
jgi:signal peptidase I